MFARSWIELKIVFTKQATAAALTFCYAVGLRGWFSVWCHMHHQSVPSRNHIQNRGGITHHFHPTRTPPRHTERWHPAKGASSQEWSVPAGWARKLCQLNRWKRDGSTNHADAGRPFSHLKALCLPALGTGWIPWNQNSPFRSGSPCRWSSHGPWDGPMTGWAPSTNPCRKRSKAVQWEAPFSSWSGERSQSWFAMPAAPASSLLACKPPGWSAEDAWKRHCMPSETWPSCRCTGPWVSWVRACRCQLQPFAGQRWPSFSTLCGVTSCSRSVLRRRLTSCSFHGMELKPNLWILSKQRQWMRSVR